MSDVLENLATIERALAKRGETLAGSLARGVVLAKADEAARTQALAEAMTNTTHIFIGSLSKAQRRVVELRLDIGDRWPDPDVMDSYVFLVSEVGEVGDALIRSNYGHGGGYSRNNTKYVDIGAELGDVFLMLCTLATKLGINLDEALQGCIDKLRKKHDTA